MSPSENNNDQLLKTIKKIDIHTHIIPERWPDWNKEFGYDGWLTIKHDDDGAKLLNCDGSVFRKIDRNCWCPETRLEECDQTDVTIQVLSTVPGIGFNYKAPVKDALVVAKFLNNHISTIIKGPHRHRFLGLGTVPLQDIPIAIVELKRCVLELGLSGVQIGSHFNGSSLDDQKLEEFWSAVEELDCAVFVHPWDMSSDERAQKYWFPWLLGMPHETAIAMGSLLLGGVLERHPKLRICFAHGGGCFPSLVGRIRHGFYARPDLCQTTTNKDPIDMMRKVYVDSLVHDSDVLEMLIKKMGSERIILGSDYPFPLGEIDRPGKLIESTKFNEKGTTERLCWKNAAEFLKLNLSNYTNDSSPDQP